MTPRLVLQPPTEATRSRRRREGFAWHTEVERGQSALLTRSKRARRPSRRRARMMSSNSGVVRQILPDSATRARTGTASCYTASSLSLVEIGTRLRSPYTVFSVHSNFLYPLSHDLTTTSRTTYGNSILTRCGPQSTRVTGWTCLIRLRRPQARLGRGALLLRSTCVPSSYRPCPPPIPHSFSTVMRLDQYRPPNCQSCARASCCRGRRPSNERRPADRIARRWRNG